MDETSVRNAIMCIELSGADQDWAVDDVMAPQVDRASVGRAPGR